jgi:Chlorophyll A-B binding protein
LGFDPLGLTPKTPAEFDLMRTKEVNNGRLAMIGIAGIVAQELVTSQKVFNF